MKMFDCTWQKAIYETIKMKPISKDSVESARNKASRRICFATIHKNEPKKSNNPNYVGTFNLPFGEGFARIFPYDLFHNTHDRYNEDSVWRSIDSEDEFKKITKWVENQGERVFMRDCLYTSIALSFNFTNPNSNRTKIGELEYKAKQKHDTTAVEELATHCISTILDIPLYNNADLICAVPPAPNKNFDVPSQSVSLVSSHLKKDDITKYFKFGYQKKSVTSASLNDKWDALDSACLSFNGVDITNKNIILIDDKYQSGTTIQYIAMKLQESGACQVYGLSIVKTLRDTDNQ